MIRREVPIVHSISVSFLNITLIQYQSKQICFKLRKKLFTSNGTCDRWQKFIRLKNFLQLLNNECELGIVGLRTVKAASLTIMAIQLTGDEFRVAYFGID